MPDLKHNAYLKAPELRALVQEFCEGYWYSHGTFSRSVVRQNLFEWISDYDLTNFLDVADEYFT